MDNTINIKVILPTVEEVKDGQITTEISKIAETSLAREVRSNPAIQGVQC